MDVFGRNSRKEICRRKESRRIDDNSDAERSDRGHGDYSFLFAILVVRGLAAESHERYGRVSGLQHCAADVLGRATLDLGLVRARSVR